MLAPKFFLLLTGLGCFTSALTIVAHDVCAALYLDSLLSRKLSKRP